MQESHLPAQVENSKSLFICFDFATWNQAKMWSYVSSYLVYHDGEALGNCELQILAHEYSEAQNDLLIKNMTFGRSFDLVVVWLPHANISKKSVRLLESVSGRLVFLLIESLVYTEQDIAELPHLANRWAEITALLTPDSCVICLCPATARLLIERGFNAMHVFGFWPNRPPKAIEHQETTFTYAFAASLYNEARRDAARRIAQIESDLNLRRLEIVDNPVLTARFDSLMAQLRHDDKQSVRGQLSDRATLCAQIAQIRRALWEEYLRLIGKADFMITLPSYFKGVPGRVIEARICNVPVIFYETNLAQPYIEQLKQAAGLYFSGEEGLADVIADLYKSGHLSGSSSDASLAPEVFPTAGNVLNQIRSQPVKKHRTAFVQRLKGLLNGRWAA